VVVSHLEDLLAAHLPDQLGMAVLNMLLYLRNKLVIGLALNVRSAFAMNDLCHWLPFPDRLRPAGLSELIFHLGLSHALFEGSAACAWAEREAVPESSLWIDHRTFWAANLARNGVIRGRLR
jgi:hypothetical protein